MLVPFLPDGEISKIAKIGAGQTIGKASEVIPKLMKMNNRFGTLLPGFVLFRYYSMFLF